MATSRSSSASGDWIAGVSIYSGRPDPTWPVDATVIERLEEVWSALKPWVGKLPSPPGLGYRGCFVRGPGDVEWRSLGGAVTLTVREGANSRADPEQEFERIVLASAPVGAVPASG